MHKKSEVKRVICKRLYDFDFECTISFPVFFSLIGKKEIRRNGSKYGGGFESVE